MQFSRSLLLALKGCAMGMADVVPGVSGGTIAFVSGIYEELIDAIRSIDLAALRLLLRGRFRALWQHIHGAFLLPVLLGIGVAIFSLARVMTWLLAHYPIQVWAFFFGLIIASALLVARQVTRWNLASILAALVGAAVAAWITLASPAQTPDTWWFVLLSGAVAICAMILPGISGAFILLLLGKYQYILGAIGELNLPVIALFGIGAAAGILSFSRLLAWLLRHWHDATVALLMGFMIGSLNKVWPWKQTVATFVDRHGELQPLVERNIAPDTFAALTGADAHLPAAVLLVVLGFATIYGVETAARLLADKNSK